MVEIDLLSFIPALFGALLSLYNWLQMHKPAAIHPNEIVEYGVIKSDYEEAIIFAFPLIFHNDGAFKSMITNIKVGFKVLNDGQNLESQQVKYLENIGKAKLSELTLEEAELMDYEKFNEKGYSILKPTYPIPVLPGESENVVLMARSWLEDENIPIEMDSLCVVEVFFGNGKSNELEFPFFISKEAYEGIERLKWYRSIER